MLLLLSPAKTLDYASEVPAHWASRATRPDFVDEASALIERLRQFTPAQVAQLMDLSDALAQLNVARYAAWSRRFTTHNSRPAAWAFHGDVYEGLDAASLSAGQLDWAQDHVVILSGLYGALRPLDKLQPYRLEMGTRLAHAEGNGLYHWWGDKLVHWLHRRLSQDPHPWLLNLASQEYAKAVLRPSLQARVLTCAFEERQGRQWKVVSFHAKRARGLMARYAIERRVTTPDALRDFAAEGYAFDAAASEPDRWVFRRASAPVKIGA